MGIKKYYFLLLVILLAGFTNSDIRKEIIVIDWQKAAEPENKLGYTFSGAGYDPASLQAVPVYFRNYKLEHAGQDFQVVLENPEFEEIEINKSDFRIDELPFAPEVKKSRLISGDSHNLEIQIPAVIQKDNKVLLLTKFQLKQLPVSNKSAVLESIEWKQESVLNNGKWLKISAAGRESTKSHILYYNPGDFLLRHG